MSFAIPRYFRRPDAARRFRAIFALFAVAGMLEGVHAALPVILSSPQSTTVHVGDDAVFHLVADGVESVRWYVNGVENTAQTGVDFTLPAVQIAMDKAKVRCLAVNASGIRSCDEAILTVLRPTREMMTFTGDLTDQFGKAVGQEGGGSIDMVIELYRTALGGSPVYQEVFLVEEGRGVPVSEGRFLARLGTGRVVQGGLTEALQAGGSLHVQFRLGNAENSETLEPRVPLTSMPYAFTATSSQLRGSGSPIALGLDAPVGSQYVDQLTSTTWIRSFKTWVKVP